MKKIILIVFLVSATCHPMEQMKQRIQRVKQQVNTGASLFSVAIVFAGGAITYGYCQPSNGELNQCVQQGLGASIIAATYAGWQIKQILLNRWHINELEKQLLQR